MSVKITTPFGHGVPTATGPAPRHSVTVHFPGWDAAERYGANSRAVIADFKNAYPRMKPHRDIAHLSTAILNHTGLIGTSCLLFASIQSARECVEYSISPRRDNGVDKTPVPVDRISIRAFVAKDLFFVVFFPLENSPVLGAFWSTPGVGISSRFAEVNLRHLGKLHEIALADINRERASFESPAHAILRQRIVQYLDRAPLNPNVQPRPGVEDVYFFPTGMASIYKPHTYLLNMHQGTTILFGMAFLNTVAAFQEFGVDHKFFGLGTEDDLRALAVYLEQEHQGGRKVQAIWAEFPANPLLVVPNLRKLRELADRYNTVLAIDDTIGGLANIDITAMTDILVTSLTKSFNGYADVIAGSAILNPASRKYAELKSLFEMYYVPELYIADAETVERNSRDFLTRTAKLNHNAQAIVQYLQECAQDPMSAVKVVHYPTINSSGRHYEEFMRPPTADFTAGYGCLFNVELEDLPTTIAFYETLNVHKGPHLGAPFTLAYAYCMCAYGAKLQWAASYGLRPTQIRISAGLEDENVLLEEFRIAVEAADRVKAAPEDEATETAKLGQASSRR